MATKKKVSKGKTKSKKVEVKKRGRPSKKVEVKKEVKKRGRPSNSGPKKVETPQTLTESQKYTEAELKKAESFLSNCDSRVYNTIKHALQSTPKESWNLTTTIVINSRTDVLNTYALAKILMN